MSNQKSGEPLIDIARLRAVQDKFAKDRDWEQFHSPKNLVMALTGEVGELAEIFQWMSEADSKVAGTDPATAEAVEDELADVLLYLVRLSSALGVDLNKAVTKKLLKNEQKYPVERAKGSSKKYNKL
ncbi:nucleotide pyrophosphohydrolase [Achromobacter insolitus]|uniref:nucleotide pyrophosphohydrolase n=1 Tax=Achromobacter insolitus TaxID=217204 RepID=UPI0007C81A9D|nr:nucleotide pyrophosphohydrolase [Achromobacter insolitus]OCZ55196.1 nucleotide pyrophosphohydrolase [Achromobacter insolitus]